MLFAELETLFDPEPRSAAINMALDDALLRASVERPILRVYRWAAPAVSFGYFIRFAEVQRLAPARDPVRRWTGGGIVLHGEDFTYALIVPRGHPAAALPPRESYQRIHAALAGALKLCGLEAGLSPAPAPKISEACFENAAEADVALGPKKIAGAAQRRTRQGILHQGSVQGIAIPQGLGHMFAQSLGRLLRPRDFTGGEMIVGTELARDKYGSDAWLRRR